MPLDKSSESTPTDIDGLIDLLTETHVEVQKEVARSIDIALVIRNWLFGWYIVNFESGANERKQIYGKQLIQRLSDTLTTKFGRGFSTRALAQYRRFYLAYSELGTILEDQSCVIPSKHEWNPRYLISALRTRFSLGWTHYVTLLSVKRSLR